ncbi:MAG: hypothetical protein U0414_24340 [Polyangiaceae bacterium]
MSRVSVKICLSSVALLLTTAALGCAAPEPDAVCSHMETLKKGSGGGMCGFKMMEMRELHRDQYKELAPCIMDAKDSGAFNACLEKYQK